MTIFTVHHVGICNSKVFHSFHLIRILITIQQHSTIVCKLSIVINRVLIHDIYIYTYMLARLMNAFIAFASDNDINKYMSVMC